MAQLKERDTDEAVHSGLTSEEIEKLEQAGVEVEKTDQDEQSGSGAGNGDVDDESEQEDEQQSAGGDKEEDSDGEEQDQSNEEFENGGVDEEDLEELEQQSDVAGEGSQQAPDDIEEQIEAAGLAGGGDGDVEMSCFESCEYESDWAKKANQYGNRMGRMLVDHFEQERRNEIQRNQRSGRFDSGNLIDADRGSPRVFKNRDRPDEKKYHAVIAMDDSGSMSGSRLRHAAITTGMLVQALEDAGINTTVYRFARNVRIVKTHAQSYSEVEDNILEYSTNGGTCLYPAIEKAEEIAEGDADEVFLVTVTDGKPRRSSKVRKMLNDSNMSSITIQIERDAEDFKSAYDGWVYVDEVGDIPSKTQAAFRRVML